MGEVTGLPWELKTDLWKSVQLLFMTICGGDHEKSPSHTITVILLLIKAFNGSASQANENKVANTQGRWELTSMNRCASLLYIR